MRYLVFTTAAVAMLAACSQGPESNDSATANETANEVAADANLSATATVSPENAPPMSPAEQAAYDEAIECAATMESARALTEESARGKTGDEAGAIMREVERLNEGVRTVAGTALGRGARFGKTQSDVQIAYGARSFEISRERGSASIEDYARTVAERAGECAARLN